VSNANTSAVSVNLKPDPRHRSKKKNDMNLRAALPVVAVTLYLKPLRHAGRPQAETLTCATTGYPRLATWPLIGRAGRPMIPGTRRTLLRDRQHMPTSTETMHYPI